jgi:hypothetical protein
MPSTSIKAPAGRPRKDMSAVCPGSEWFGIIGVLAGIGRAPLSWLACVGEMRIGDSGLGDIVISAISVRQVIPEGVYGRLFPDREPVF